MLFFAKTVSIHQVVVDPVDLLHVEELVTVSVLIVCSVWPILINQVPVVVVDIIRVGNGVVRVFDLRFSLRLGLLICV